MPSAGRTEPAGRPQQLLLLGCLVCVAAVTPLKRMGPETDVRVQGRRGLKSGTGKGLLTAPHSSPRKTSPGSLALLASLCPASCRACLEQLGLRSGYDTPLGWRARSPCVPCRGSAPSTCRVGRTGAGGSLGGGCPLAAAAAGPTQPQSPCGTGGRREGVGLGGGQSRAAASSGRQPIALARGRRLETGRCAPRPARPRRADGRFTTVCRVAGLPSGGWPDASLRFRPRNWRLPGANGLRWGPQVRVPKRG